jgi:hypothetical protein
MLNALMHFLMNVFISSSFFIIESIQDPTMYRLKYFDTCFKFLDIFSILIDLNLNLKKN